MLIGTVEGGREGGREGGEGGKEGWREGGNYIYTHRGMQRIERYECGFQTAQAISPLSGNSLASFPG